MTTVPGRHRGHGLGARDAPPRRPPSAPASSKSAAASSAPAVGVVLVGEAGGRSGATLDANLEAGFAKLRDGLGDERDAPLAGSRLLRNRDSHAAANSTARG